MDSILVILLGILPMRKIVKEILEAESRVGAALQEARQRAAEMRRSAESEASEKIGEARRQAQGIVQAAVEEARRESVQIREEALRRGDQEGHALLGGKTEAIEDLVTRICDVILNTESEGDPDVEGCVGKPQRDDQ